MAESVDAADLKSASVSGVPVQVWPGPPFAIWHVVELVCLTVMLIMEAVRLL